MPLSQPVNLLDTAKHNVTHLVFYTLNCWCNLIENEPGKQNLQPDPIWVVSFCQIITDLFHFLSDDPDPPWVFARWSLISLSFVRWSLIPLSICQMIESEYSSDDLFERCQMITDPTKYLSDDHSVRQRSSQTCLHSAQAKIPSACPVC